jgi:UDP-N-acetylmuramoyl-tripeptide--D-alanyl-D-alanine ligase
MTASILRAWKGERAAATRGNLNNHIGLPLTVLTLRGAEESGDRAHQAAVFELGMNHPGEIAQLAAIAQPTVAVVNNAQREHQEYLQSVQAVAEENGAVLTALPADGIAVFPADDAYAPTWLALAAERTVWRFAVEIVEREAYAATVGPSSTDARREPRWDRSAEVEAQAWREAGQWQVALDTPVGSVALRVALDGRHNVHNAVAAATAALAAGAPIEAVQQGLAAFRPVQGRSLGIDLQWQGHPVRLIDDSYNANPDSVRAAIDLLSTMPAPQALILGDMGEVGNEGPAFHAEVGRYARERGIQTVWTVGEACIHTAEAAGSEAKHFGSVPALVASLQALPACGSILVKGSRFMRMERVVQALQSQGEPR